MNLKQYLSPQVVGRFDSRINKNVELVQFGGNPRLDMGGLIQSGHIIEDIWQTAFKKLLPKNFSPQSVLILGFGAGSAARLVHRLWPNTSITGVEIDPQVINIAKKHFSIDTVPNLQIINADAYNFVYELGTKNYELALVDCYLGDQIPDKLQQTDFFLKLKKHSGYVLINRLFWGSYQQPTLEFLDSLEQHFSTQTCRTPSNFIISIT